MYILQQPIDALTTSMETVTFTFIVSGATSYLWQYSKRERDSWATAVGDGINTQTMSLSVTSDRYANKWRCAASDGTTTIYSNEVKFITATSAMITTQPTNFRGQVGSLCSFSVVAENATTYQWQYKASAATTTWTNASFMTGATTSSASFTVTSANAAYIYRCLITGTDTYYTSTNYLTINTSVNVLAMDSITLQMIKDIASISKYYLLQSSTQNPPSTPTTNPPGGSWTTTEPSYSTASTNSLYTVDLNVFSDGTFSYTNVALSSSYEAAKAAYNQAIAAGATVDSVKANLESRGEQLVTNGNGILLNNTNFAGFNFDPTVTHSSPGSFTYRAGASGSSGTVDYIPIVNSMNYKMDLDAISTLGTGKIYAGLSSYDIDKNAIYPQHTMYVEGTNTTLAQDLNDGDTIIYLNDIENWNTSNSYHNIIFWNYTNSKGYTYPINTYSRNVYQDIYENSSSIDFTNKTITLKTAWANGTIVAGTAQSQGSNGVYRKYFVHRGTVPNEWTHYSGYISGEIDYSGKNDQNMMHPGTAYVKVYINLNPSAIADEQLWVTNISLKPDFYKELDEVRDETEQKLSDISTQITETSESIQNWVQANYTTSSDTNDIKGYITTLSNQTAEDITWSVTKINNIESNLSNVSQTNSEKWETLQTYMQFASDGLRIGKLNNPFTFRVGNEKLSFYMNDTEVAYLSNNKLYVTQAQILTKMQLGSFAFEPQSNGNMSIVFTG